MRPPEDIASALPPADDDRSASVRRDIADELADHLTHSFEQETTRGADEATAWQRVRERFGNPDAVARQLWFDAMKEKIMSQRLLIAAVVLIALLSVGICGATWLALTESRSVNQAIITELRAMREASGRPDKEWVDVQVRLVDAGSRKPLVGKSVSLVGKFFNSSDSFQLQKFTDENGLAAFGMARPGQYQLDVPIGAWGFGEMIVISPEDRWLKEIQCPSGYRPEAEVRLAVNLPGDLLDDSFFVHCEFRPVEESIALGGARWYKAHSWERIVNETGTVIWLEPPGEYFPHPAGSSFPIKGVRHGGGSSKFHADPKLNSVAVDHYRLNSCSIFRLKENQAGKLQATVIAMVSFPELGASEASLAEQRFEAKAEQENVWRIDLPKRTLESLRAETAAEPARTPKRAAIVKLQSAPEPVKTAQPVGWGTIKGRIVWGPEELPKPKEVEVKVDRDWILKDGPVYDETVVVNPTTRGVRNVIVHLKLDKPYRIHPSLPQTTSEVREHYEQEFEKLNGVKLADLAAAVTEKRFSVADIKPPATIYDSKQPVEIKPVAGRFHPHTLAVREGQATILRNADRLPYNLKVVDPLGVNDANPLSTPNSFHVFHWSAVSQPLIIEDGIRGWMKVNAMVFDHPYFTVTDENGRFQLSDVPAGGLIIESRYPRLQLVNGSNFLKLEPGERRDLGEIKTEPVAPRKE